MSTPPSCWCGQPAVHTSGSYHYCTTHAQEAEARYRAWAGRVPERLDRLAELGIRPQPPFPSP